MNPKDKHTRCWCQYSAEDCGNVGCSHKPHRERLIVVAHGTKNATMAELWCEMDGEIKFCPVCGRRFINDTRT